MHFLPEQIELLWIIPVIALVVFIFIIQLVAQQKETTGLSREVAQFNIGSSLPINKHIPVHGGDRLSQLEKAISTITDSLTVQQQAISQFNKGNVDYSDEVNGLKAKLRELYKEYDIVMSENYSLRAKVKKMQGSEGDSISNASGESTAYQQVAAADGRVDMLLPKVDMKLYEDTRTLNLALLDDTSEIDLSDLTRRPS